MPANPSWISIRFIIYENLISIVIILQLLSSAFIIVFALGRIKEKEKKRSQSHSVTDIHTTHSMQYKENTATLRKNRGM